MKKLFCFLAGAFLFFMVTVPHAYSQQSNKSESLQEDKVEEQDTDSGTQTQSTADSPDISVFETSLSDSDVQTEESPLILEPGTVYPEPEYHEIGIEGVDHELTKKYREQYMTDSGRAWLSHCLAASVPYRPYIQARLKEKNMPMFLQYIPVVESNYKITAVSQSGATGLWQFMANSMSPFLKRTSWYDERLDPWKSTDAALRKLSDNYAIFGDWALAIAAYNCGAGAMTKILKLNPDKDFWWLAQNGKLPKQSAQYVPKLLAVADIVENAAYYGALEAGIMDCLIADAEPEEFDYITIAGMMSLSQIAELSGIPKETVTGLNPALFRNCTPAGTTYMLRLPHGSAQQVEAALTSAGAATDALVHTVKKGDSLWAISREYGLTVQDLCEVNNIRENGILSIGQQLIVPIFK
ncbi:MAG: transglycosylase SLT domain-containing protein [Treponema sp.]|nr:transglycosylase SLT domain-containing protein [Treponema sp.]